MSAGYRYSESDVPATLVGMVLGARVFSDGTPSPFLAARLDLAKRLYDAGRIQVVVVSGDAWAPEFDEPAAMVRYLLRAGLPADRLIVDGAGLDTYDSCSRLRRIFGVDQVMLLTQSYHLPRAVATGRALGVRTVGVGDDSARQYRRAWRYGTIRDQVACVKTVWDIVSRRDPLLGPPQTSVAEALARRPPVLR
jgi:vancomycin permeability regulator SanA